MAIVTQRPSITMTWNARVSLLLHMSVRSKGSYPNVCERWIKGFRTITTSRLAYNRHYSHEHSDEAVLKDP